MLNDKFHCAEAQFYESVFKLSIISYLCRASSEWIKNFWLQTATDQMHRFRYNK